MERERDVRQYEISFRQSDMARRDIEELFRDAGLDIRIRECDDSPH